MGEIEDEEVTRMEISKGKSRSAWKIGVLLGAVVLIASGAWWFFRVPPRPKISYYNVLYLTADSFNRRHLAMYGYHRVTTPYLEELAKSSAVFDKMINPSGWTNENLVSIFSSLSSPIHHVETRMRNIDPRWITPIEILREYGYRAPRLQGWQGDQNHSELGFEPVTPMHPAEWLERYGNSGPFFLFHQFLQPHLPYNGDGRDTALFRTFFSERLFANPSSRERIMNSVFRNSINKKGSVRFLPEDAEPIHALYDGELLLVDREMGRTIETLKRLGLYEKTIIIIGADHGEEQLEHGFVGHASTSKAGHLYDEIVNIPFLIHFPPRVPARFIRTQVRGIDVMPTVLDLLGIPVPEYLEGRSLMPVIRGEETKDRTAFIQTSRAGYGEPDPKNVTDHIRAVRTGEWKLIHYYFKEDPARFELYHVSIDTMEQRNVIDSHPAVANRLRQELFEWLERCAATRPPDPDQYLRKSPWQKVKEWWLRPPPRTDFTGVPSPPVPLSPKNGDVITFRTAGGKAILRWSGEPDVPYVIEYEVGKGDYHLTGTMKVLGNRKVFGPFPRKYWDTYLALYSPYRARVSIDKEPREWSPWVEFEVRPVGEP